MKRMTSRTLRRLGLAIAIGLPVIGAFAWYWVIPAAIVAAIRTRHEGYVAIAGWWIDGSSAGVTGLALHEGPVPISPTWAAVDRVSTDLSLGGLLRGRTTPQRIAFDRASIACRIGADGQLLTKIPMKSSGAGPIPELVVHDGTLAMRQEGRPELVVHHLDATMSPDPEGPRLAAKADDADWGHPTAEGRFTPDFTGYNLHLTADRVPADPDRARSIPFVEEKIWQYVEPRGPVGVVLDLASAPPGPGGGKPGESAPVVITTAIFQGTTVKLPTLGLLGEDATGRLIVRDKVVELQDVKGRMCDGRVGFSGPMDFRHKPDRYALDLTLDGVNLDALPESWQLHRVGVHGRFSGTAGLRLVLAPEGLDLTGSIGKGVVDGAEVRGIPLHRLDLALRGEGLRSPAPAIGEMLAQLGAGVLFIGVPASSGVRTEIPAPGANPGTEGPFLAQWIRGEFRVKEVEIDRTLAHLETPRKPGGTREIPVSGRLDLSADIRFPLGSLEDWKAYTARGTADIAGAQIGGLDLGRLRGRLDMADGVVEVADLCGRLLDRPGGGGRPPATEPPSPEGPLPRGGFRGRVRAVVAGEPDLRVDFEGVELPIAEIAAAAPTFASSRPASESPPEPLPLSGRVTLQASGRSRGASPSDPRGWTVSGRAELPEIGFRSTVVKDVSTDVSIEQGRLVLPAIAGKVGDAAFKGRLKLELTGPYAYDAEVETGDLSCRELLGMVPNVSGTFTSQLAGTIVGRGKGEGSLQPWQIRSDGQARVAGLRVGRVTIGDVPLRWATKGEAIQVTAEEHQRYGGKVSAEARVPVKGDRPIEGTVVLAGVDSAELTAGGGEKSGLTLTGRADGRGWFRYTPGLGRPEGQGPPIEGGANLTSSELKLDGVSARSVTLAMTVHEGNPKFEVTADGLGGKLRVSGDGRLASDPKEDEIRAQVEAIGLQLYEIWGALGVNGAVADLRGRVTLKGEGRARGGFDLEHARGEGDLALEDLIWGYNYRLAGRLQGRVSQEPGGWRVGPLGGDFFGGKLMGDGIWMSRGRDGRPRYGVDAQVDRLELARAMSFLPDADRRFATAGTLRISGNADGSTRGTIEFHADRGQINGLQLSGLHIPGEWTISLDGPQRRGLVRVQKAEGRLGGGRIGGEAQFALGDRKDFRARMFVDDVDLRIVSREEMGSRPVPGRLSGYVNVHGSDPANLLSYRGELDFDLTRASLVDIPLLDELDRALGSTGGGVFDDGNLHGTIAERRITIDNLTLVGPLAQVHAHGTVDFDGRLNLEVVVNNQRGVYQSGQAAMSRAPNVAEEVARRASQIDQVRDFVSSRLMKFRITGTIYDPVAHIDRSINPRAAMGFFLKTMRLSAQSR